MVVAAFALEGGTGVVSGLPLSFLRICACRAVRRMIGDIDLSGWGCGSKRGGFRVR